MGMRWTGSQISKILGVKFPCPVLASNCAEKPILWMPIEGGAVRFCTEKGGKSQKAGRY